MGYRILCPDPATGVQILELSGDLDLQTVPPLDEHVGTLPTSHLVVDVSAVEFMDSTGIGFLLRLRRRGAAAGHRVIIAALSPTLRRLLVVTGVSEWLEVCSSVPEATRRIRSRKPPPPPHPRGTRFRPRLNPGL